MSDNSPSLSRYLWDYDINEEAFLALLRGEAQIPPLDQDWAAVRLLEYAPYAQIRALIGFKMLVARWSFWREKIRSSQRRDALDFLVEWLPRNHPELL